MIKDLVYKNKTYRRFYEDEQIDYQTLKDFIDLARLSPTARNQQALKYKIITDKQLRNELFSTLKWAGYLHDWDGPEEGERPSAYILIGIDNNISSKYIPQWTLTDLGIAMQTILLAAAEKGYGGCVIVAMDREKQRQLLDIPENIDIQAVIALGKPKENVIWTQMKKDDNDFRYWRDDKGNHYVPKRSLDDILL